MLTASHSSSCLSLLHMLSGRALLHQDKPSCRKLSEERKWLVRYRCISHQEKLRHLTINDIVVCQAMFVLHFSPDILLISVVEIPFAAVRRPEYRFTACSLKTLHGTCRGELPHLLHEWFTVYKHYGLTYHSMSTVSAISQWHVLCATSFMVPLSTCTPQPFALFLGWTKKNDNLVSEHQSFCKVNLLHKMFNLFNDLSLRWTDRNKWTAISSHSALFLLESRLHDCILEYLGCFQALISGQAFISRLS